MKTDAETRGRGDTANETEKPTFLTMPHKPDETTDGGNPRVSQSPSLRVSSDSLRILLWDIDGTLIRSVRPDSFKDYTIQMLEEVFGTAGRLPELRVSGMTDLEIVGEALRDEGFTHEHIRARITEVRERYMTAMRSVTGNGEEHFRILPGVRETLAALAAHPRYRSALMTGNIEAAAYYKMELVGLSEFFTLPGSFGDESHDRRDLPALAADRIRTHLQLDLKAEQFIVIGDTPNDIACAQHFGARALAVGTSRMFSAEDLLACHPDALLPDLADVSRVMQTLDGL